ncbi:MAG: Flp pilus assembly complex ATPase component TadA [Candidatus Aureabacteria bacterium]|nr:Flp pilus assembly complex ATPase component TadA [Candidatus Auribacterota bacterium]
MLEDNAYEIGEALIGKGIIMKEEFDEAINSSEESGVSFLDLLIDNFNVDKNELYNAIGELYSVPAIDLNDYVSDPKVTELVNEELAKKFIVFPVFSIGNTLTVTMADPTDIVALDQIRVNADDDDIEIEPCISSKKDILEAINKHYRATDAMQGIVDSIGESTPGEFLSDGEAESPVTKLVNVIIKQAVTDNASDIHIEPEETFLRVRFRIDGILYEIPELPKHLQASIISRLKVISNLDIAETRVPQDGHFKMNVDGKPMDARISTVPTVFGENVVIRLLNPANITLQLEDLGFNEESLMKFETMISNPYGVILTTGPTGSGKTTTLYATLNRVNSIEKNVITIEDPVEYNIGLVRQIPVNLKTGLTFARGLRATLRQDPDIVMVGEIRDTETAEICVQAALTGHLVFSTLHTNDSTGALARLINMGVEPFLISSSIVGIIAQRLVRKICDFCKESYVPSPAVIKKWGLETDSNGKVTLYKGTGCPECRETGYKGRRGIYEVLTIDDDIRHMVIEGKSSHEIKSFAIKEKGLKVLAVDGIEKVKLGITTLEEVSRVTETKTIEKREISGSQAKESTDRSRIQPLRATSKSVNLDEYQKKLTTWIGTK